MPDTKAFFILKILNKRYKTFNSISKILWLCWAVVLTVTLSSCRVKSYSSLKRILPLASSCSASSIQKEKKRQNQIRNLENVEIGREKRGNSIRLKLVVNNPDRLISYSQNLLSCLNQMLKLACVIAYIREMKIMPILQISLF